MKESMDKNVNILVMAVIVLAAVIGCGIGVKHIFEEHYRNKQLEVISQNRVVPEIFQKGNVLENGYESAYLNLRYSAPEGFRMCEETEIRETFTENVECTEMGTVSTNNGESIYLFAEDLPEPSAKIEKCISAVKAKIEKRGPVFTENGDPIQVLGREFKVMYFTEKNRQNEVITEVLVRKQTAKMVYMVLTYPAENRTEIEKAMDAFGYY